MIPYLRLYDSSVHNYLKYEIIAPRFTETEEDIPLVFDSTLNGYIADTDMTPSPTSRGRGWAIFDENTVNGRIVVDTTAEQTTKVNIAGASTFDIDYANGRILNWDTAPTTATYDWYYVSVIQGWPGLAPPELPVVAIDLEQSIKTGYQLGGGTKDILRGAVHIFATSHGEKLDLADVVYHALFNRQITIGNWHEGSYLDFDGTYSGFVPTTVSGLSTAYFTDVQSSLVGPILEWSELNRYRASITFGLEVLKND